MKLRVFPLSFLVTMVGFSGVSRAQGPADQLLAVAGNLNEVRVVSATTGETIRSFGGGFFNGARSIATIPGTRTCVVASELDQKLVVFNYDTGAKVLEFRVAFRPRNVLPLSDLSHVVWFQEANAAANYSNLTLRANTLLHGPTGKSVVGGCRFRSLVYGVTTKGSIMTWITAGGEPMFESADVPNVSAIGQPIVGGDGYAYGLVALNSGSPALQRFKITDRPVWDSAFGVSTGDWASGDGPALLSTAKIVFSLKKVGGAAIGVYDLKAKKFSTIPSSSFAYDGLASFIPKS
jgi:hypothetical protein